MNVAIMLRGKATMDLLKVRPEKLTATVSAANMMTEISMQLTCN